MPYGSWKENTKPCMNRAMAATNSHSFSGRWHTLHARAQKAMINGVVTKAHNKVRALAPLEERDVNVHDDCRQLQCVETMNKKVSGVSFCR